MSVWPKEATARRKDKGGRREGKGARGEVLVEDRWTISATLSVRSIGPAE
jgi:hypothetical protein